MKNILDRPARSGLGNRALPARNAMLFWFGTSLVVWAALAASAIWLI